MNEIFISLIIPVYNVEKYLDKCIKSILNQTFQQYEVILVDDGSTDRSSQICDDYADKESKICVIHKDNGGVSSARNCGLENAKGDYVAFVDADDFLDQKYLEILYQNAIHYGADISCCDCVELIDGNKVGRFHLVQSSRIVNSIEEYLEDYVNGSEFYATTVWGKLIRTDMAVKYQFKNIKFGEDTVYMLEMLQTEPLIFLDAYAGYYYVRNKDSATVSTKNSVIDKLMDQINIGKSLIEMTANCSTPTKKKAINVYAIKINRVILMMAKEKDRKKKHLDQIESYISEILRYQEMDMKYRIMFTWFLVTPKICLNSMYLLLTAKCIVKNYVRN